MRRRVKMKTKNKRPRRKLLSLYFLVPRAGIEPAHPKVQDFESSASTSSATRAFFSDWTAKIENNSGFANTTKIVG